MKREEPCEASGSHRSAGACTQSGDELTSRSRSRRTADTYLNIPVNAVLLCELKGGLRNTNQGSEVGTRPPRAARAPPASAPCAHRPMGRPPRAHGHARAHASAAPQKQMYRLLHYALLRRVHTLRTCALCVGARHWPAMSSPQVLSWIDVCAGLSAKTLAQGPCVTASVDAVHFLRPCRWGLVCVCRSCAAEAY